MCRSSNINIEIEDNTKWKDQGALPLRLGTRIISFENKLQVSFEGLNKGWRSKLLFPGNFLLTTLAVPQDCDVVTSKWFKHGLVLQSNCSHRCTMYTHLSAILFILSNASEPTEINGYQHCEWCNFLGLFWEGCESSIYLNPTSVFPLQGK